MTKWNLLGDRVLIAPDPADVQRKSGIHLPQAITPPEGTIVAIGPGYKEKSLLKVGYKVSYGPSAGIAVKVSGKSYLMMRELEIFRYKK